MYIVMCLLPECFEIPSRSPGTKPAPVPGRDRNVAVRYAVRPRQQYEDGSRPRFVQFFGPGRRHGFVACCSVLFVVKQFLDPLQGQAGVLPLADGEELFKVAMGVECPLAGSFRPVDEPFLDVEANFPTLFISTRAHNSSMENAIFHDTIK